MTGATYCHPSEAYDLIGYYVVHLKKAQWILGLILRWVTRMMEKAWSGFWIARRVWEMESLKWSQPTLLSCWPRLLRSLKWQQWYCHSRNLFRRISSEHSSYVRIPRPYRIGMAMTKSEMISYKKHWNSSTFLFIDNIFLEKRKIFNGFFIFFFYNAVNSCKKLVCIVIWSI